MAVTAGWPLHRLVDALARAGWGDLTGRAGGGVRGVLNALARLLPPGTAAGLVTAYQLADAAGISDRWTRSCLAVMERAGLITWRRGAIVDGAPTPSYIRVEKRRLAQLVGLARRELDGRRRRRAAEFARRLATALRERTVHRRHHERDRQEDRSPVQAELSASLSSLYREEVPPPAIGRAAVRPIGLRAAGPPGPPAPGSWRERLARARSNYAEQAGTS